MRWKIKQKPKLGDKRIKKRFAWYPISVGKEIRWLEFVTIDYRYSSALSGVEGKWVATFFEDENTL